MKPHVAIPKATVRLQMGNGGFQVFKLLSWSKKLSLGLKGQNNWVAFGSEKRRLGGTV